MNDTRDFSKIVQYISAAHIAEHAAVISSAEHEVLTLINQKVAAAPTLDNLMRFVFEATEAIFPCDRIGLAFVDSDRQRIVSRWVAARYSPVLLRADYSEGRAGSTLEKVLESGEVRIIHDLDAYLRLRPNSRSSRLLVKEGVRSSMTCPLYVDGRVVGLMFRSSRRAGAYSMHQAALHSFASERMSQAIEKVYRIGLLESANNAYLELLSFASHELRSPLASLIMDCDALIDGFLGELKDEQRGKLGRIKTKATELLDLTKDYLDLSKFEGGQLKLRYEKNVRIFADLLVPVLDSIKPQLEEKRIVFEREPAEGDLSADLDSGQMRVVLENLLSNAVKYGVLNGIVRVCVREEDDQILISVWNSGPGFPAELRSKLFQRFSRLSLPEFRGIRGSGVGLYNAWRIVELHGGKMDARSEYGSWAEFTLRVPLMAPQTTGLE